MFKVGLFIFSIIVFINADEDSFNSTSSSIPILVHSIPSTNQSSLIENPVTDVKKVGNHTKRHKVHVKNIFKVLEKSLPSSDIVHEHNNSISINNNITGENGNSSTDMSKLIKERTLINHVIKVIENSSSPTQSDSNNKGVNNTADFLKDEYESMTPAWLVGLAIIGFVLAIFLIACFVSIGFSMVDVSF